MNCALKFLKQLLPLTIMAFIALFPLCAYCENTWQLAFQPRQRVVKIIGTFNKQLFIGTGNGVFVSKDEGTTWQDFGSSQLQKDTSGNSFVNWIYIDKDNEKIYIATSFGAYYSDVNNPDWHKLFESTKTGSQTIDLTTEDIDLPEEDDDFSQTGQINSITADNDVVYLSTNDGFWICNLTLENKCQRINEGLEVDSLSGNYEIFYSLKRNNDLFLATSNGIYIFDNKSSGWIKLSTNIQKLDNGRINARHLFLDKEQNLWASCGTGVYFTGDKGKTWQKRSGGIKKNNDGFQEVFYLFESKEGVYAACASGIYFLNKEQNVWQDITGGIRTKEGSKNVYCLAKLNDKLFSATDEGLFVLNDGVQTEPESGIAQPHVLKGKVETEFSNLEEIEPSVIEVQKQALKFASLPTTNDYKRYRMQARLRNLVPRVGLDLNTTGTSTDYYQSEKGISTDTSLTNDFTAGNTSRLQRDGKSFKQLSVLWNTDQLLYDDEMWRILNQARLTANIKENLLDDVTRIYFQRKKLQLDSLLSSPRDIEDKLARELSIAELTGQLDSRTGGWFSKEIQRRKQITVKK